MRVEDVDLGTMDFWAQPARERDRAFAVLREQAPLSRHDPPEDVLGVQPAAAPAADLLATAADPDVHGDRGQAHGLRVRSALSRPAGAAASGERLARSRPP